MVDLKEWDSEKEGSEELLQAQGFVVNFTINGWSKQFKLGGFYCRVYHISISSDTVQSHSASSWNLRSRPFIQNRQ
jgi:hypothetical protein